jgi:hypothetical protein
MSDTLPKQSKTALDEARLLFLGVQLFLGFQFQAVLQDGFSDLQVSSHCISLTALMLLLALSVVCWFGLELAAGIIRGDKQMKRSVTPLATKVEKMLREAGVILLGAQALFGFQLVAMLTMGVDRLPASAKALHTGALCLVALNVIPLITRAARTRLKLSLLPLAVLCFDRVLVRLTYSAL